MNVVTTARLVEQSEDPIRLSTRFSKLISYNLSHEVSGPLGLNFMISE